MKSLDSFQKDLGNWHDWWNTGIWLEGIKKTEAIPGIDELIEQVEKKEASTKREMIRNIKLILKANSPKPI
jgi:CHAD domain-containing protein